MDRNERSLEQAALEADQVLRLFSDMAAKELDAETTLLIEINGVPVGNVTCLDSALAELAAGWTFLHRYFENPREFDRSNAAYDRASVMIHGGQEIELRRDELLGMRSSRQSVPDPWPRDEPWSVREEILLDILREGWGIFRGDRMAEGSVHAALASESGIEVVAFDITSENAVAKVLGWSLISQSFPTHEILIVNGLITRAMVDAAARLGVQIIATPNVATNDAWRASRLAGISIVAYMRHRTAGMFHDHGLVITEVDGDIDT